VVLGGFVLLVMDYGVCFLGFFFFVLTLVKERRGFNMPGGGLTKTSKTWEHKKPQRNAGKALDDIEQLGRKECVLHRKQPSREAIDAESQTKEEHPISVVPQN